MVRMNVLRYFCLIIFIVLPINPVSAANPLELLEVTGNVYAIVGDPGNRTSENLGNNATFGFIVTSEGVVLIDSGGSYQGAEEIHELIKPVTDKPVVTVINTGGQDHRWMGNGYFRNLGARIIANQRAVKDQRERGQDQLIMLQNLIGVDALKGTSPVYADDTFDQNYRMVSGGTVIEIYYAGQAHTPGDSFVWLPREKVMFTGDIVFTERMLGILDHSNSKSWVETYQAMAAYKPAIVVPGHGHPTDLAKANADTYGYLMFLRRSVAEFMEAGGSIVDINKVDQDKYKYLVNYETLAGRNAQKVFEELEWE